MESDILHQLELIRSYVFIIMVATVLWLFFKILESAQKVFIDFKKTWDTSFENKIDKLMDLGEYNKVITECKEVLEQYPNHIDATWYSAKAFYYLENNKKSIEYFEKAIYLVPAWEETASVYLNKLKDR